MIKQVLTQEQIDANHQEFIELLRTINREGSDIERLISKLESSDCFLAPASTMYHGAYPGGLVDHSLCVYHNLVSLINSKHLNESISMESIIVVSLLHDMDKVNKYTTFKRNVPPSESCPSWTKEDCYKTKDTSDLFMYGNHEQNSEYLVRQFIPLTLEESTAILHHMGGMAFDSAKDNISGVYDKYPLALLLHLADMISSYIEKA